MEKILNDFELESNVSAGLIDKYADNIPNEIMDLWKNYGFGTFMQGYFKSVNPDDYKDILRQCSERYKDAVVLFTTAMGDLIVWAEGYVRVLNFRHGVLKTVMPNFSHFFKSLHSEKFLNGYVMWQPYPKAVETLGEASYDECFGYTPILGLGGAEEVENLEKVKLREHILIITEFMGPIQ